MRGRYRQRQMAAIVSRQLDKFGQYTIDVSSSAPLVEDLSDDQTRGKEIAREWHTTGVSMHRPKQSLDEEATQLWNSWQVRRARVLDAAPTNIASPRDRSARKACLGSASTKRPNDITARRSRCAQTRGSTRIARHAGSRRCVSAIRYRTPFGSVINVV